MRTELAQHLSTNLISLKALHSFTGKVNHIAGLLVVLRPFLQPLWAALYPGESNAPRGTVWAKQLHPTLKWLESFLEGSLGGITRRFTLDAFLFRGPCVDIGTDASPYGMGGWLSIDGKIVEHFATGISAHDQRKFDVSSYDSVGQQIWEVLAMLVALRLWLPRWANEHINLSVRGDNVGALVLLLKMRPKTAKLAIIAREIALLTIQCPFMPRATHTPGISHVVADQLSRRCEPGKEHMPLHWALQNSQQVTCPARDDSFYKCTLAPSSA